MSIKIMIVDDSDLTIKKLSNSLQMCGYEVVSIATDGSQVIEKFESSNPDIVTMDITMKNINGIEATKSLIEKYPNALVMMVTSVGQEKMVVDAIEAGAKGYILKPWDINSLNEHINKLVDKFL